MGHYSVFALYFICTSYLFTDTCGGWWLVTVDIGEEEGLAWH